MTTFQSNTINKIFWRRIWWQQCHMQWINDSDFKGWVLQRVSTQKMMRSLKGVLRLHLCDMTRDKTHFLLWHDSPVLNTVTIWQLVTCHSLCLPASWVVRAEIMVTIFFVYLNCNRITWACKLSQHGAMRQTARLQMQRTIMVSTTSLASS